MRLQTALPVIAAVLWMGCGEIDAPQTSPPPPESAEDPDDGIDPSVEIERALSETIPPDERLLYLDVSLTSGFAGKLRAGDRVDVVGVFPGEEFPMATTLLQNATTLDVETTDDGAKVGLSLTTDEVEMLTVTAAAGDITLLARHPDDMAVAAVSETTLRTELEDLEITQERRQVRARKHRDESRPTEEEGRFVHGIAAEERALMLPHGLPGDSVASGDRVDIVLQADVEGTHVAITVLQNVRILDVPGDHLTLGVTGNEAKMLLLMQTRGELVFTLRNRENAEISTITKKTLRGVLEDLEVIQEKRMMRIRRPRRKKKAARAIEIIRGDTVGSPPVAQGPTVDVAPKAGQLTAGEWRDLEHWDHWTELALGADSESPDNFAPHVAAWGISTERIVPVVVRDAAGTPVPDAEVELLRVDSGRAAWTARTDNRGRAWLFDGIGEATTDGAFEVVVRVSGATAARTIELDGRRVEVKLDTIAVRHEELDVALVVDTTGSMSDELEYLQSELRDVLQKVGEDHADLTMRTSVNFYRDAGDDYVVRPFPFTDRLAQAERWLMDQSTAGGGDQPEAVDQALHDAIYEREWSEHARARLLFVVLDAPPHGEDAMRFRMAVEEAAHRGIRVIPVVGSGMPKSGEYLLRAAAIATGGTYVFLTDDSGIGKAHTKPTAGPHDVGYLNDLLRKLIGEWVR